MPLRPGVFQFGNFMWVALGELRCISILGPNSSIYKSFSMFFLHSAFLLWFLRSHILFQNLFAFLGSWYLFAHPPLTSWLNFLSLFWNVLFCLYCLVLYWYLFSLPSLASTFWFISSSCIFCSNRLAFFTCSSVISCFSAFLAFLLVVVSFLRVFPI